MSNKSNDPYGRSEAVIGAETVLTLMPMFRYMSVFQNLEKAGKVWSDKLIGEEVAPVLRKLADTIERVSNKHIGQSESGKAAAVMGKVGKSRKQGPLTPRPGPESPMAAIRDNVRELFPG